MVKYKTLILKLERLFFYLLIFLIPLQTRKFLYSWNPEGFNEYLSAYLYVSDIILGLLFLVWIIRFKILAGSVPTKVRFGPVLWVLSGFFLVGLVSLTGARNMQLGIYQLIKLGEFLLLFLYIRANFKLFSFGKIAVVFVVSALLQSFIGILQFFKQSDLGLRFLQESPLHPDLSYVANFFVGPAKIIRAYGGFPHPNVLAAFLIAALFFLYFLFLKRKGSFKIWDGWRRLASDLFLGLSLFVLLLGLLLTFSRAAIGIHVLATFVFFIILIFHKKLRKIYLYELFNLFILLSVVLFLLSVIFYPYLISRFQINPQEEAVVHRAEYSEEAQTQVRNNLFFGVGIGNFIPTFKESALAPAEEFYQPVHNIYLLIASEMGIVGVTVFVLFLLFLLYQGFRSFNSIQDPERKLLVTGYWLLVTAFLAIGFFDHFFWTLQQGRLMFWIILGLFSGLTVYNSYRKTVS